MVKGGTASAGVGALSRAGGGVAAAGGGTAASGEGTDAGDGGAGERGTGDADAGDACAGDAGDGEAGRAGPTGVAGVMAAAGLGAGVAGSVAADRAGRSGGGVTAAGTSRFGATSITTGTSSGSFFKACPSRDTGCKAARWTAATTATMKKAERSTLAAASAGRTVMPSA